MPRQTLSNTVFQGKIDLVYCWKTYIISGRGAVTVSPLRRTAPEVGADRPAAMCSSVDLPQPDGPISATNSLCPTANEMSSQAARPCALNCLLSRSISRYSDIPPLFRVRRFSLRISHCKARIGPRCGGPQCVPESRHRSRPARRCRHRPSSSLGRPAPALRPCRQSISRPSAAAQRADQNSDEEELAVSPVLGGCKKNSAVNANKESCRPRLRSRQPLAGDSGAFAQGLQFCPDDAVGHLRFSENRGAKTTIDPSDEPFAVDDFRIAADALRH